MKKPKNKEEGFKVAFRKDPEAGGHPRTKSSPL